MLCCLTARTSISTISSALTRRPTSFRQPSCSRSRRTAKPLQARFPGAGFRALTPRRAPQITVAARRGSVRPAWNQGQSSSDAGCRGRFTAGARGGKRSTESLRAIRTDGLCWRRRALQAIDYRNKQEHEAHLRGRLDRAANYYRAGENTDVSVPPPTEVVDDVLALPAVSGRCRRWK